MNVFKFFKENFQFKWKVGHRMIGGWSKQVVLITGQVNSAFGWMNGSMDGSIDGKVDGWAVKGWWLLWVLCSSRMNQHRSNFSNGPFLAAVLIGSGRFLDNGFCCWRSYKTFRSIDAASSLQKSFNPDYVFDTNARPMLISNHPC